MGNCCLVGCLRGLREDEIVRASDTNKAPKCVYRDDLKEKPPTSKEGDGCASGTTDHHRGRGGRSKAVGVRRVKILVTKQEAALLLSNCKVEEGVLKCKLSQLQRIVTTTTCTPPSLDCHDSWKPTLESLSEEL